MSSVRMLVVVAVFVSALTSCNSDEGWAGWGFRNLGKRAASNVDAPQAKR
jgi:hypothetical protein